jgi:hypothetical protein
MLTIVQRVLTPAMPQAIEGNGKLFRSSKIWAIFVVLVLVSGRHHSVKKNHVFYLLFIYEIVRDQPGKDRPFSFDQRFLDHTNL